MEHAEVLEDGRISFLIGDCVMTEWEDCESYAAEVIDVGREFSSCMHVSISFYVYILLYAIARSVLQSRIKKHKQQKKYAKYCGLFIYIIYIFFYNRNNDNPVQLRRKKLAAVIR